MNRFILEKEVQNFIKVHREKSPVDIALKKTPFLKVSSAELATQIDGWQRAVRKLPTWAHSEHIYYPNKINLEQCSSEHTALIKQNLIEKNSKVIDITGGFGVDSCYMAQEAKELIHCEINHDLSEIVAYNASVLGVSNIICLAENGIDYLTKCQPNSFDYIYVDPSRRVNQGKVFLLADCEPNIINHQNLFFQVSPTIISKLSPLLDISTAIHSLSHVRSVYIISLDNDCKELLFVQERGFQGEATIYAIRLYHNQLQKFEFTYESERNTTNSYTQPAEYLYDPDVSITKAGAFKSVGRKYHLGKIHQHSHLYSSQELNAEFPGRIFQIKKVLPYATFKKNNPWPKANITTKNFPERVEVIRKKHKIKDGGDCYLFFTTDLDNQLIVIQGYRIK